MLLVFSYEHSKPKAFVPLAWAGAVLAGMAAETLITMGVKATSKAVLKKKADDYAAQALKDGKFDFMGTNPYRNKDGSITLSPTANDRAKMAGLISGALIGSMALDSCERPSEKMEQLTVTNSNADTSFFYITSEYDEKNDYPIFSWFNKSDGRLLTSMKIPPDGATIEYRPWDKYSYVTLLYVTYIEPLTGERVVLPAQSLVGDENDNYKQSVSNANSVAETIQECADLYFPSSMERVYNVPMDKSVKTPNEHLLVNIPLTIKNVLPPSETDGEITWVEIEDYYNNSGNDFSSVIGDTVDGILNKGILAENVITIGEINNIYTDTGLIPVDEFVPVDEDGDGEDNVPVVPGDNLPVPVEPIDKSLIVIAKESYQYLADTVKSSVDGLTAVTAGATGLITFLSTTMGWLPNEWIVMFSAAFGLGLFAFFFRR